MSAFSTAGKGQGFADEKGRGTIFFSILEYIKKKRPKVFILENVKAITTLEDGKYLKSILRMLNAVGKTAASAGRDALQAYKIEHTVLNTKDHGIPQNRARWYCVGIRKDTFRDSDKSDFEFP